MATKNTKETTLNATYVINPTQGNIKVVMTTKKEAEKEIAVTSVAAFAPNKRYSIYNNGGGYTGL